MFLIKSYYLGFLLLATCSILVHCTLEPSMATDSFPDNPEAVEDKNGDGLTIHKRPSFFVGSRYGRSGSGVLGVGGGGTSSMFATSKARRLSVVPRTDRFFLGSRYGKRSREYISPYEQDGTIDSLLTPSSSAGTRFGNKSDGSGPNNPSMMSCVYTGLKNLYRCNNIEINNILNQLTHEHPLRAGVDDEDDEK